MMIVNGYTLHVPLFDFLYIMTSQYIVKKFNSYVDLFEEELGI